MLTSVSRRQEIPGSETKKDFITAIVVVRESVLRPFIKPQFLKGNMKRPADDCTSIGLCYGRGNMNLRGLLDWAARSKLPVLPMVLFFCPTFLEQCCLYSHSCSVSIMGSFSGTNALGISFMES